MSVEKNTIKSELRLPSLILTIWPAISLGLAGIGLMKSPLVGVAGVVVGLMWGLSITYIGRRLVRSRWHTIMAAVSLFGTIIVGGILLGGGLVYQLLVSAAASHPETLPTILQPAIGGVLNMVFISCNSAMEYILVPLVVLLNWSSPKRRILLIFAATIYYLSRIWTYSYFALEIIDITNNTHPGMIYTATMVDRFQAWVNLDWGRNVFDLAVSLLFTAISFVPFANSSLVKSSRR